MPKSSQGSGRTKAAAKRRLEFGDVDSDAGVVVAKKKRGAKSALSTVVSSYDDNERTITKDSVSVVPATPEKKRRRRRDGDSDHKQGISLYFSPSKTTKTSAVVTPEKKDDDEKQIRGEEEDKLQQHVPIYIHKNLNYQRRGSASLNQKLKRAFDLVEDHYVIPSDFESNRSYGPLSGTCFEERAVNAYDKGLLLPKQSSRKDGVLICCFCSELGHTQDDCPKLI
jgi:hypothetical protein